MKKALAVLLSLTIILGGIIPIIAHADQKLDKELETTIIKLKKLFSISNEYDGFTQRLDSDSEESNFYLNWTDSKNKLPNIEINTDSKGFIKSYSKYYSNELLLDKSKSITKIQAQNIALEFINKIAPEIESNIKLKEKKDALYIGDDSYNFEFYRMENNIPFYNNNITLSVNKFNKEVNNYNANWDKKIIFPKSDGVITKENAIEAFKAEIGLHLIYKNSYEMYRMPGPMEAKRFLAYSLLNNNKAIEAFTGKPIDINYYRIYSMDKEQNDLAGDSGLTPYEQAEIDKLKGLKSIDEIEKLARIILGIDETYKLENKNLFSSWNNKDEFQWMLSFIKNIDENNNLDSYITLDAKTGELISFSRYQYYDTEAKPTISKEEAFNLAKEYINKNLKLKVNDLEYVDDNSKDGALSYNFQFIRKSENIYIESDGVNIGIDTVSKKVVSYSINWYKGELPSKENIISLDKAYDILFNNKEYELRYVTVYNENSKNENKEEIKLVYGFKEDNIIIIDPITGKFLDNQGKEISEQWITEYTDIDNSYAKKEIQILSEYGISFKENKFRPKDKMKQSEFLYLLWKSLYNSPVEYKDSNDEMYTQLKDRNIVRAGDKDKNTIILKEDAAMYIIRALNYDKIADASNIFKNIWADSENISPELKGYLNIAYGLKLINGDGKTNNINPKYELKREDGAKVIYNYLFMK